MYQLFQCLHVSDVLNRPAATTACTSYVVPPIASDAGYLLKVSASFIAQQCSDAIKRAQILKEKMGLPKSVAMPAAQMQQPAALQSLQQLPGSTTSSQQEESDEQGLWKGKAVCQTSNQLLAEASARLSACQLGAVICYEHMQQAL